MVVAVVEECILGNLDCVFVAKNKNQTSVEEKSNNEINVSSSILARIVVTYITWFISSLLQSAVALYNKETTQVANSAFIILKEGKCYLARIF
jgi:hypothetical protein